MSLPEAGFYVGKGAYYRFWRQHILTTWRWSHLINLEFCRNSMGYKHHWLHSGTFRHILFITLYCWDSSSYWGRLHNCLKLRNIYSRKVSHIWAPDIVATIVFISVSYCRCLGFVILKCLKPTTTFVVMPWKNWVRHFLKMIALRRVIKPRK